ncbi:hypothetical protein ACQ4PT_013380 [Festuca glaucescens]
MATAFYVELLGRPQPRDHDLSLEAIGMPVVDLSGLEAQFTEEEVWAAVKAMPGNKTPGPDGLSWEFFRACWGLIKADVLEAVHAVFLGRDRYLDRLNSAYIALLPKKEGAADIREFRPISLVHSFGKRITKVMALRLAPRMAELVGCNQSAFIRGRCIQDNFVWFTNPPCCCTIGRVLVDLCAAGLKHRLSLYADDIVVFARPDEQELVAVKEILACFGAASGLRVNYLKISAVPIRCDADTRVAGAPLLDCPFKDLPQQYLGLQLSLRKPSKAELQLVLDKLAAKVAFWKARLMLWDGRVAYVRAVMAASVVYQLMALDVDPWFLQAVDKLRRGFLWAGKNEAHGGNCLVAWDSVCAPKHLGGLELHNLRWMHARSASPVDLAVAHRPLKTLRRVPFCCAAGCAGSV